MKDPFQSYYSAHAIAARLFIGREETVHPKTIHREIARQPVLAAAAWRKFGHVFLPWTVLKAWLELSDAAVKVGEPRPEPAILSPVFARSEGELTRKVQRLVQTSEKSEVANG